MASNDVIVRLRMLGAAAFQANANAAATSVRGIGDAADKTAGKSKRLDSSMAAVGAASAKVGRFALRAGAAVATAGGAAVAMGVKFDAGMEQSRVAFTNLLGSADKAETTLDRLYDIAAHTPFEFPELTKASQKMLGFGLAAKDLIPTMTAIGDAVAASGGGAEQIGRITTAFGQMQAKGKVSAEELRQMSESGVPALKILQEELGMTGQELDKALRQGLVHVEEGMPALIKGINKRYAGMAEAQSKTFLGLISTLRDNLRFTLGVVMKPIFDFLERRVLPAVEKVTNAMAKWARTGGVTSAVKALREGFTEGAGAATSGLSPLNTALVKIGAVMSKVFTVARDTWNDFYNAIKPAMPFIQNVMLPLLKGIAIGVMGSVVLAFKVLIAVIRVVAPILGWIGQKAAPLKGVFQGIGVIIGTLLGPAILHVFSLLGKFGGIFKVVAAAAKIASVPIRALVGLFGGLIRIIGKLFTVLGRMGAMAARAVQALIGSFRPGGFVELGKTIISGIVKGIMSAPRVLFNALKALLPGGKVGSLIRKAIPGLATGGVITRPGLAMVGERGPELLGLDRGARVMPLPSPTVAPIAVGGLGSDFTVAPVYLDGRVIGEVMAQRTADRRARR